MSSIASRIIKARKLRGLSQARVAERMKVSRGACGHWERGKAAPSTKHLAKLAQILQVRVEWLATGKGGIEAQYEIADSSTPSYSTWVKDDETNEVAQRFYRLSKRKRQIILDLLREL